MLTALADEYPQRDWGTWLVNLIQLLFNCSIYSATRCAIFLGSAATIFGTVLTASRLAGVSAGVWTGVLLSCYAPFLWNSILIGPDAMATGVMWLGLGLAFYSSDKELHWSILGALIAAFSCIFAAKIKITAFPATSFLGILPFLAMKKGWKGFLRGILIGSLCLAALLWLKNNWMNSNASPVSVQFNQGILDYGIAQLQLIFDEESILVQLAALALLAVVLAPRNRLIHLLFLLLCAAAMLVTASTLGNKIRPRYFVATSLPILIVLSGSFANGRLVWLNWIKNTLALGLMSSLFLDSLAYHNEWSKLVHRYSGTELSSLPEAPDGWTARYRKFPRLDHDDHSTIGAKRLHELSSTAKASVIAGIPLRDGREHHLSASAGLSNHKYVILTPKFCCEHQPDLNKCAQQTMDQLVKSNTRLILPIITRNQARIPNDVHRWHQLLLRAAKEYSHFTVESQWGYLDSNGSQKTPCSRRPKKERGFWEIDGERPSQGKANHRARKPQPKAIKH